MIRRVEPDRWVQ